MKECRITDRWTLGGLQTIVIENELLRLSVLVDLGARIHEFVYKPFDRDFFWHNPRHRAAHAGLSGRYRCLAVGRHG